MGEYYTLGPDAIRQIKKMKADVQLLQARVFGTGNGGTKGTYRTYAKITGSDGSSYSATEVYFDGTTWTATPDARTWDATGFAQLHEINGSTAVDNNSIFPIVPIVSGDTVVWGFEGGATMDDSVDVLESIDTDTTNQVSFTKRTFDYAASAGYVQDMTDTSATGTVLSAIGKRVGIEVGGVWRHLPPTTGDEWITTGWDGTNWTVNGVAYTDATCWYDNWGHLEQVTADGTTWNPTDTTNYRYRHCSDPISNPDIVLSANNGNTIEISGNCYQYLTTTAEPSSSPTIDATHASCAACEGAAVNEQWKNCDDNTDVAVLPPDQLTVDYAWLCESSAWVKCYNSHLTSDATATISALEQCDNAAPASCNDLVGWPSSDDFGGSGCNSGAVDDTDWTLRWQKLQEDIWTISGALLQGRKLNAGSAGGYANNKGGAVIAANDFTTSVSVSGVSVSSGAGGYADVGLFIEFTDGNWITIRLVDINGTKTLVSRSYFGGTPTDNYSESNSSTSGSFSVVRTGTSWAMKWNGTTKHTYTSLSKTVDKIMLEHYCQNAGDSADADWDDFVLVDGSSAAVRIDPTGVSC